MTSSFVKGHSAEGRPVGSQKGSARRPGLLGNLRLVGALTKKKILHEAAYKVQLLMWLVAPFLGVAIYVFEARFYSGPGDGGKALFASLSGTAQYSAFIAIGATMYNWVINILWEVGFSLRDEQEEGTLEQLWLTPAPRWLLVAGTSTANTVVNSTTSLVVLLLTRLAFGMSVQIDWGLLLFICVISWVALYGLGFVYSGMVMLLKDAQGVVSLGNEILLLLSGAVFPLGVLPLLVRRFAKITPLAWVLSALRGVTLEGRGWTELRTELVVVTGMAMVMPALGYLLFTRLETLTRRRGSLGGY